MASKSQQAALKRIQGIDPEAESHENGDLVFVTYVPKFERGRTTNGVYRENPNPQKLTHVLTPDGRVHGWAYESMDKIKLPAGEHVTTAEDMKAPLSERAALRNPPKEPKAEEPTVEETTAEP
jgi:hypothetical protein